MKEALKNFRICEKKIVGVDTDLLLLSFNILFIKNSTKT